MANDSKHVVLAAQELFRQHCTSTKKNSLWSERKSIIHVITCEHYSVLHTSYIMPHHSPAINANAIQWPINKIVYQTGKKAWVIFVVESYAAATIGERRLNRTDARQRRLEHNWPCNKHFRLFRNRSTARWISHLSKSIDWGKKCWTRIVINAFHFFHFIFSNILFFSIFDGMHMRACN